MDRPQRVRYVFYACVSSGYSLSAFHHSAGHGVSRVLLLEETFGFKWREKWIVTEEKKKKTTMRNTEK